MPALSRYDDDDDEEDDDEYNVDYDDEDHDDDDNDDDDHADDDVEMSFIGSFLSHVPAARVPMVREAPS